MQHHQRGFVTAAVLTLMALFIIAGAVDIYLQARFSDAPAVSSK